MKSAGKLALAFGVAALQAHAVEVSDLVRDGMVAMMRGARAAMER